MGIFEVVENKGALAAETAVDLAIALNKDSVDFPKGSSVGQHTSKVVNANDNGLDIVQLATGRAFEDADRNFQSGDLTPITYALGGVDGVSHSNTTWIPHDLKPGEHWMRTGLSDPKALTLAKDQVSLR